LQFTLSYIVVGAVFIVMALSGSLLRRLPLSTSMLYLVAGVLIGPHALDPSTSTPSRRQRSSSESPRSR
jgi:Kef-type K+ transport system membrane component KefB